MSDGMKSDKPVDNGRGANGTGADKKPGSTKMGVLLLTVLGLAALCIILYAVSVAKSMKTGVASNTTEEKKKALPESAIASEIKSIELPGKVELKLVKVEAGSFEMSSKDKSNFSDEKPHKVTLKNDFYLGRTEVTQAQYQAVMGVNPSKFEGGDLPVEQVTWYNAMEFCKKLNDMGKAPTGWKFTLPTETQWEYASRGGRRNRGCKFSGSDELDEVGWYGDSSKSKGLGTTHPAAQKKANELGLFDMSGNVWEWTLDDYVGDSDKLTEPERRLKISGTVGTKGKDGKVVEEKVDCQYRTMRGGSWSKGERYCRNAQRYYYNAKSNFCNIGFRVALVKAE
jgi:formylglycine-generating enzyme required for sulfatase activity